jgi:hypothetical protein
MLWLENNEWANQIDPIEQDLLLARIFLNPWI